MKKAPAAEFLWRHHRAALDGKSAITGQPLPETLAECPPGPQGAHWGMALAVARLLGHDDPPLPPGVSPEEAARIRRTIGSGQGRCKLAKVCSNPLILA